jgi:hypothetical protein
MSKLILAPAGEVQAPVRDPRRRNVQLSEGEQTCVYVSTLTGRILGFGHASMRPFFTEGWERHVLYHAWDIDKWAEKYRKQEQDDRESKDYERSMCEQPARRAIRQALLARRAEVSPANRAYIDANLKLMDLREERMKKRKEEMCLLSEKHEAGKSAEDLTAESAVYKIQVPTEVKGDRFDMPYEIGRIRRAISESSLAGESSE